MKELLKMLVMPRPRMYFDADEELRVAIKQAALREGVHAREWIENIIKREIGPKGLDEAKRIVSQRKKRAD
jgi:hypothetical protein